MGLDALLKETGAVEKTVLDGNPQGCRRRGRPKRMWQRTIEDEIRSTRRTWNEVKGIAGDHNAWKLFMDALCSTRSKRFDEGDDIAEEVGGAVREGVRRYHNG